jgi:hypothetical protein
MGRLTMTAATTRNALLRALPMLAILTMLGAGVAEAQPRPIQSQSYSEGAKPVVEPELMGEWLRRLVGRYRIDGMVEVVYAYEDYPDHRCAPAAPDPAEAEDPPPPPVPYCSNLSGKADCIGIGKGPGVQCVFNILWQDIREVIQPGPDVDDPGMFELPGGVPNLAPSMAVFGLEPHSARINYLLVDQKGLAEGGRGGIVGDRATLRTPCANGPSLFLEMKPPARGRIEGPPRECERILRFDAGPDSTIVNVMIDIEINGEVWTRFIMTMRRES